MSLSNKQLQKLVSGNTVYRTLVMWSNRYGYSFHVEQVQLKGKRFVTILYGSSLIKVGKINPNSKTLSFDFSSWFLSDLHGSGCFKTRKQAEKFMQECKDGLHPDVLMEAYDRCSYNFNFE